jgi:hypothetical protein
VKHWVAVWLVLLLCLVTLETGVHSVHHLGRIDDPDRGCVVANAKVHFEIVIGEAVTLSPLILIPLAVLVESAPARGPIQGPGLPQQRAPPLALFA